MSRTILKSWGLSNPGKIANFHTDVIRINKGGYSSCHVHAGLANGFILIDGAVDILRDDLALGPCELRDKGDLCLIAAGERHQFYALEDSTIVEFYVPGNLVDWDSEEKYAIERYSDNGMTTEKDVMVYRDGRRPRWIGYSCSDK